MSVTSIHPRYDSGDGIPPADRLKIAIEEYRFQAEFNWSRSQYLLAFSAAVLAAGSAVAAQGGRSATLIFGLGAVAALMSCAVIRVQHGYYRAARDRMRRVEESVGVPAEERTDTTSTLGGRRRVASVNQVLYLLFVAIALADTIGAIHVATR